MKRSEMNGRATKRQWQKISGGWLWAVAGLFFGTSCRVPAPQAGRYQWTIVSHDDKAEIKRHEEKQKEAHAENH